MTGTEIAEKVNEIIQELYKTKKEYNGVNWSSAKVSEVFDKITTYPEEEETQIVVVIDEVSPDAYMFKGAVQIKFYEQYQIRILVETEW